MPALRYELTLPARINILGNPTDANEGDFATISAAVDLFAGATVEAAGAIELEIQSGEPGFTRPAATLEPSFTPEPPFAIVPPNPELIYTQPTCGMRIPAAAQETYPLTQQPLPYTGQLDLMKAAFNRLHAYSPELRSKLADQGVRIAAWSAVPRQSGLAGSTLFVLLTLAALRELYQLDRRIHNDYLLAELAQRAEALELGIACGFADRYVPLFGGLAYLDYRGKLHQRPILEEPLVTYERLDKYIEGLPLVAISTGVTHQSGEVHGRMRPRYVAEYDAWQAQGGPPPEIVRLMQGAYETAWRGKIALLHGDLEQFGELMDANHRLVDRMMSLCGFEDGAGWANNRMIEAARGAGALGAKLTGAGGGGSVFALARPGEEARLERAWEQAAAQAGLQRAQIYRPQICPHGLQVRTMEDV